MRIERQVIRKQADVVRQQGGHATLAKAGQATIFTFPEPAVMHQNGVGLVFDSRVDQSLAGGDATNDRAQRGPSFHLQSVWAIIVEA
jgi:hypothetical protein